MSLTSDYSSHTHRGLMSQLNFNYVKQGKLLPDEGKLVRQMFNMRHEGDYENFEDTTEEDIKEAKPKVEALVDKLIRLNSETA